jgi:hypothetical protein
MPVTFQVNKLALHNLRDKWDLPPSVLAQANVIEDETGRHTLAQQATVASANQ